MTFPASHLLPLGVCLAIGSIWDVAKRRIPNALTSVVALGGITAQIVDRGGLAALSGVAAAVVSIALLYKPWTAGGLGGGDVKLAAAVAIWVGLGGLFRYAVAVAAAGGLVAAMMYFLSRKAIRQEIKASLTLAALNQSLPPVPAPSPGRLTVPYGLAIAAGAAFALLT
ncbi:MAG TPA: A24 family peptidase [Polyangia bacterium]|nr:A24 family peptidase [Polyangia bacterium]